MSEEFWRFGYEGFDPDQEGLREALCTLGNGRFCTRGAAPESRADGVHYPGTYRAGCYDRLATTIHGETVENESLVNLPNWLALTFRIEGGPWFDPPEVELLSYRQELDLRGGVLGRAIRFRDADGRECRLAERRFVSMAEPHLAGLELRLTAVNWSGILEVRSGLDGRVENAGVERYRELEGRHLRPVAAAAWGAEVVGLVVETLQSRIQVAEAARLRAFRGGTRLDPPRKTLQEPGRVEQELTLEIAEAQEIRLEKMVGLSASGDPAISEPAIQVRKTVERAGSFDDHLSRHRLAWKHLWRRFEIVLDVAGDGDVWANRVLRLHIFHLLQTVSEHGRDLDVGVPARGWHGEAYRGHVFWDELFIFPFLNLRAPDLTRALLRYRHRRLPEARHAARAAGYEGAMFPWQSGSDGREESQVLHLNPRSGRWIPDHTHLQRHINAAIPFSTWRYWRTTGDVEFLASYGAELILECARFWASIASYDPDRQRYVIRGVVGPDEYHTAYPDAEEPGIDNNAYTNVMAAWTLCRALEALDPVPAYQERELRERLGLADEELQRWEEISRRLFVPFHGDGIISQFEGWDELRELDWERYRREHGESMRLDRILEAEEDDPNRYRASKQADVLMLFYLLSARELGALLRRLGYEWSSEAVRKNVEYYVRRTSHGSTLSGLVHAWVLSRLDRKRSWEFFQTALRSDVADVQEGTTPEGIHLGAMAGTVDLLQRCYTGLEVREEGLWFDPGLPEEVDELIFRLLFRGQWLSVRVTARRLRVSAGPGPAPPIRVGCRKDAVDLGPGQSHRFHLGGGR